MHSFRRPARLVVIALAPFLGGCHSYRAVTLRENPDAGTRPPVILVTLHDGSKVWVNRPEVRGDSLYGEARTGQRVALPVAVAQVSRAEVKRASSERTAALVLGLVLGAVALQILLFAIAGGP